MDIIKISPKGFAANTYLLTADGMNAVAIDAAQPRVFIDAAQQGLNVRYVLLTHGHFDHTGGCAALQRAGAKIGCLKGEEEIALRQNLGNGTTPPFTIDFTFTDGEELELCWMRFFVLATPGHTAGSASFIVLADSKEGAPERALFTGDTLFRGDVGRTDFPTGSEEALKKSLQRLSTIDGDCPVYPGHGANTTIAFEKKYNRWMQC